MIQYNMQQMFDIPCGNLQLISLINYYVETAQFYFLVVSAYGQRNTSGKLKRGVCEQRFSSMVS